LSLRNLAVPWGKKRKKKERKNRIILLSFVLLQVISSVTEKSLKLLLLIKIVFTSEHVRFEAITKAKQAIDKLHHSRIASPAPSFQQLNLQVRIFELQ